MDFSSSGFEVINSHEELKLSGVHSRIGSFTDAIAILGCTQLWDCCGVGKWIQMPPKEEETGLGMLGQLLKWVH